MKARERSGFALLVAIVALLVVTAVGHAAFFLSRQLAAAARSESALLRARLAAEGGVEAAAARWRADSARALEPGTIRPAARGELGGVPYAVDLRRVGRELFLLEGSARTGTGVGAGAGRLFWSPEPGARVRALPAAVGGSSVVVGPDGAVDGAAAVRPPPGWEGRACDTLASLVDTLFPSGGAAGVGRPSSGEVTVDPGGLVAGFPPVVVLPGEPAPTLGLLDGESLGALADAAVEGSVTPAPAVTAGRCLPGPTNWGSPGDPTSACGTRFPVIRAPGAVEVDGGEGQGILVGGAGVDLRGGTEFTGIVVAAGPVRVREGAVVRGFVVSGGDVAVAGGGRVEASACAALRAVGEGILAGRIFPVPGGSWIAR